jgi:anti-anti-sigma factor
MELEYITREAIVLIKLSLQSLDARDAPLFKQKTLQIIDKEKCLYVVLNLASLKFIDSSGLGAFLSILRQLDAEGGNLKLACVGKEVLKVLELVSMNKIFEIYETEETAFASCVKNKSSLAPA